MSNGLEVKIGYRGDTPPTAAEQIAAFEEEIARLRGPSAPGAPAGPLLLDLGCGGKKKDGHVGVDVRKTPAVDVVCDLARERWPWADSTVDGVYCSHMLEHVPRMERVHFCNELWRVLKPGAQAQIVTPHWASPRAYGDVTHEWPPVTPWFWPYLNKEWRKLNGSHQDGMFDCDFDTTHGFSSAPRLNGMNADRVRYAVENFVDAADDMIATLVKAVR